MNILTHPNINTDVVIGSYESFFDPMDFFICYNNNIEKVSVESDEKFELSKNKEKSEERKSNTACNIILNESHKKDRVPYAKYDAVPKQKLYNRPKHSYPVLMEL